ncbi:MAG: YezD family protein [Candidatus Latescibacterota bacterium]
MKLVNSTEETPRDGKEEQLLLEVLSAIKSIKYGYVQVTIQNSKVVQVDKTEKIRLDA